MAVSVSPGGEGAGAATLLSRARRSAGVGLGLPLVKAIADLHGFGLAFAAYGSAVSIICPGQQNKHKL